MEVCRDLYRLKRAEGAPSVSITNLDADFAVAESRDGLVRFENATWCCAWALKYQVAEAWLALKVRREALSGERMVPDEAR